MSRVTPFLWLDGDVRAAADFYRSVFAETSEVAVTHYEGEGEGPTGPIDMATVSVAGQELMLFNGGPFQPFNEAISLFITCEDQDEVDRLWERFTADGEPGRCGWLKDRYGVSWQVVPAELGQWLGHPDPPTAARAREAMLQMNKIEIAALRRAADGD